MIDPHTYRAARLAFYRMIASAIGEKPPEVVFKPKKQIEKNHTRTPGVYCLRTQGFIKVGMSNSNAHKRARDQSIPGVSLVFVIETENASRLEKFAHEFLGSFGKRIGNGEWFEAEIETQKLMEALKEQDELYDNLSPLNPAT